MRWYLGAYGLEHHCDIMLMQDRRGSSGKLLNVLRVNNDLFCDLAAITVMDDSQPGDFTHKFLRYKNIPGLGIGHPAILYDNVTDLYWMSSNLNRYDGCPVILLPRSTKAAAVHSSHVHHIPCPQSLSIPAAMVIS